MGRRISAVRFPDFGASLAGQPLRLPLQYDFHRL